LRRRQAMVARNPTKTLTPFPPVPRSVTIHAVFGEAGEAVGREPERVPMVRDAENQAWLPVLAKKLARTVAGWFAR
jgi:hypothetical protein